MRFSVPFLAFAASAFLAAAQTSAPQPSSVVDPSELRVAAIQKALRGSPSSAEPHIDLAAEYCREARDKQDINYYAKAQTEVESALKLAPASYDAQKLEVSILLGRNEIGAALKMAAALNHKIPDDIAVWGLLAEINAAAGSYKEALRDAQWVLDLRPGSTLGLTEAARLREAYGDPEGAIEFYDEARKRTSLSDAEERAWLITQVARITAQTGDKKRAATLFEDALKLNPESQLAAAGLANLRMSEGNYAEAARLLETRYKAIQNARSLYDLAEALEGAGRKSEAAAAFRDFEIKAQAESARAYNANIQLIYYYLDRKSNPAEALALATRESGIRRDNPTMAALAWALYANSRYREAGMRMDEALATGQHNAVYFCRAAHIAAALNDPGRAKTFQGESLSLDPAACHFELPSASIQEVKRR